MWLIAAYKHTSLFSLKNSAATSSGGKTNLVPTMYTVKMALIDAAFRCGDDGDQQFSWIKELHIKFCPPEHAVVNNSFIKILREPKDKKSGPAFISSVGYREFVFFSGELNIAIRVDALSEDQLEKLKKYLYHINYFGKRGSFVQCIDQKIMDSIPNHYSWHLNEEWNELSLNVQYQNLDDIGEKAEFKNLNTFSEEKAKLGRDRILIPVAVPYQVKSSNRGYTLYQRTL
jgi:CRISPR/Cas system-associated protein Cas5 (RAMP superfamily)